MKTLLVSLIAIAPLATASMAAPVADASLSESPRSAAISISQNALPNSGKVTEVIPTGSYTYLHVSNAGKGTWLVIPRRDIPVGAAVQYGSGTVMKEFHSSSLERTFDEVLFLGGVTVAGETARDVPSGHPPLPADSAVPSGHPPLPSGSAVPSGHPPLPSGSAVPSGHPPLPSGSAVQDNPPNVGKVTEAITSGSYTYLRVAHDGKGTWLAIPRRDIPVGAEVRYAEGMVMKDFHSRALDRTFEEVLFLSSVMVTGQ